MSSLISSAFRGLAAALVVGSVTVVAPFPPLVVGAAASFATVGTALLHRSFKRARTGSEACDEPCAQRPRLSDVPEEDSDECSCCAEDEDDVPSVEETPVVFEEQQENVEEQDAATVEEEDDEDFSSEDEEESNEDDESSEEQEDAYWDEIEDEVDSEEQEEESASDDDEEEEEEDDEEEDDVNSVEDEESEEDDVDVDGTVPTTEGTVDGLTPQKPRFFESVPTLNVSPNKPAYLQSIAQIPHDKPCSNPVCTFGTDCPMAAEYILHVRHCSYETSRHAASGPEGCVTCFLAANFMTKHSRQCGSRSCPVPRCQNPYQ